MTDNIEPTIFDIDKTNPDPLSGDTLKNSSLLHDDKEIFDHIKDRRVLRDKLESDPEFDRKYKEKIAEKAEKGKKENEIKKLALEGDPDAIIEMANKYTEELDELESEHEPEPEPEPEPEDVHDIDEVDEGDYLDTQKRHTDAKIYIENLTIENLTIHL